MPWNDRLLEATYISPSGNFFIFQYENLSVESSKKTSSFIFPEVDGAYVQDLGRAGRRYPLTVYFSGMDYDIQADAFMAALEEKGVGTLFHPRYGIRSVVPTGTITQRDDLLTAANQAAFNVEFSETITGLLFPSSINDLINQIKSIISNFMTIASIQLDADLLIINVTDDLGIKEQFEKMRFAIELTFNDFVKEIADVYTSFQILNASIESGITTLSAGIEATANQLITLIRTPSQINTNIESSADLYESVIDQYTGITYEPETQSNVPGNDYKIAQLTVFSCLVALCEVAIDYDYQTRIEAVEIAERISNQYETIKTWIDANLTSLSITDTGESYDYMTSVISQSVSYLVAKSFELPRKKIIKLGSDRNIIELVAELYGDLSQVDYFIQTNNLTADEIELLPVGKEVEYYE